MLSRLAFWRAPPFSPAAANQPTPPARPARWRQAGLMLGMGALSALALPPVHCLPVLLITFPALGRTINRAPGWKTPHGPEHSSALASIPPTCTGW
nr:hypothetical protein [Acetobacter persici]